MTEAEPPLIRKLKKVLDTRLENDPELVESLKAVSEFFTENNIRTRRSLRSDMERRNVVIYEEFLESFRLVKDDLDELFETVSDMNASCKDMSRRLQEAKSQTEDLLKETSRIQKESEEFELRSRVAEALLEAFQLPAEQEQQLTSQSAPLTEEFFRVLQRAKQIHADCKVLLMAQNQTAGLEIMEQMSVLMECGCERLYRWAQAECRLQTAESAEIGGLLAQAFQVLQERPVLLKYALDEYSAARRNALVKFFIDALTRGGPAGSAKPIELHSHDPLRYTGDMLAWLHQGTASEIESLDSLLRLCQDEQLAELRVGCLCGITEGVCRPLRLRVEQVLVGAQDPIVLYRVHNLLVFHQGTMERVLGTQSALTSTVSDLAQLCWRLFFGALTSCAQRSLEQVEPLNPFGEDWERLQAPAAVTETLQLLQQVLTAQDSGMVPLSQRKEDMKKVLDACVSPLVKLCTVTAEKLPPLEMAIFMANSLHAMQSGLAAYEFTEELLEGLQTQLEPQLETLVGEQLAHIMDRVQLLQVYQAVVRHADSSQPLSYQEDECLKLPALKASMAKFDAYLANPDSLRLQQLQALQSSKLRLLVTRRSADQLHSAYTIIYTALTKPDNLFKDAAAILVRNPDQVAKLVL